MRTAVASVGATEPSLQQFWVTAAAVGTASVAAATLPQVVGGGGRPPVGRELAR